MYKIASSELENSRLRQGSAYQHFRTSYYTNISFYYKDVLNRVEMKVDTGASHTIIGTEIANLCEELKVDLGHIPINNNRRPEDISGTEINIKECILDNFRLTSEIIFPSIKLLFSDDIHDKAVLGMDILSLFDFQYKHEKGNMLGTFWINNYEEHLQKINNILKRKNLDYVDVEQIFLLDESEKKSVKYTQQDLEANFIQNQINQIPDK